MAKRKKRKISHSGRATRDIAIQGYTIATEHLKECGQFRKRLMRAMAARDKKVDQMHRDNQSSLDNKIGELRQALQVAGSERRTSFEHIQGQIDNLAQAIGLQDDKIVEAEKENLERDIGNERKQWSRNERIYWAIGGVLLSLVVFLLKEKFFP